MRGVVRAALAGAIQLGAAIAAQAHTVSPSDVLAVLNSPKAREEAGVVRAREDGPRLLVVEVGERWYRLPETERRRLAKSWLGLWRHAVPGGVVSVLDAGSGSPAVRYRAGGQIELVNRPAREERRE